VHYSCILSWVQLLVGTDFVWPPSCGFEEVIADTLLRPPFPFLAPPQAFNQCIARRLEYDDMAGLLPKTQEQTYLLLFIV
jgi:hypothetical protein